MQRNRVSGGSGGAAQRLYILPFRLLQVLSLRHQTDTKDLLQQSTQAGGQRGNVVAAHLSNNNLYIERNRAEQIVYEQCRFHCLQVYCCSHVPKSGPGHFDQTSVGIRQALNVPKTNKFINEQIRGQRTDLEGN